MSTGTVQPARGQGPVLKADSNIIQIGGRAYATKHVTSVTLEDTTKTSGSSIGRVLIIVFGVLALLMSGVMLTGIGDEETPIGQGLCVGVVGAVLIAIRIIGFPKPSRTTTTYTVRLTTSAGEVELLSTADRAHATQAVNAIRSAIAECQ